MEKFRESIVLFPNKNGQNDVGMMFLLYFPVLSMRNKVAPKAQRHAIDTIPKEGLSLCGTLLGNLLTTEVQYFGTSNMYFKDVKYA